MLTAKALTLRQAQEIDALRRVVEYITDGVPEAFAILLYIRENFKQSDQMIVWLKNNKMCGQKLVDMFKNESDATGGGKLLGCQKIISMMEGKKHSVRGLKINELK